MSTSKISKVNKLEIDASGQQTEHELKQSELRYHQLFNSMTDMFESSGIIYLAMEITYDRRGKPVDGVFCEINSVAERLLGKSKEQLIGKSRKEVFGHALSNDLLEKFDDMVKTGRPSHFERYGKALQKFYDVYAWKSAENRLGVISTDITEHKRAEAELTRSEEKYSSLFANMIDGLAYCHPIFDNQNRPVDLVCLEINDAFTRITGLKKEDVVGKRIKEVFPEIQKDQPNFFETSSRVALSGKTEKFEIFFKPVNLWFSVAMYSPIKGDFVIMFEDITERKEAEEELFKNRELLKTIIDGTDAVVINARDLEEKLILLNKAEAEIYRLPMEKALGTTPYDIYPKEIADQIVAWDKKVLGEGKSFNFEETIPINGTVHNYVTNKFPLRDSQGKIYGVAGIITDITERKSLENSLAQYNKELEKVVEQRTMQLRDSERLAAIGQTAGMVGHDIRNPLQAMISDLYLLRSDLDSIHNREIKKDMVESLDSLEKNINYINKIVADLQDYARKLNPDYTMIVLADMIVATLETIDIPDAIDLSVDVKGLLRVEADETFLRRALTNLINNAIQALPEGGKVDLEAFQRNDKIFITVSDTGVGIPDEIKPKLFNPMVTTKAKGQGLGLAVVKRLVEVHGGSIRFESEVGKGTKFIIELPTVRKLL